MNLGAIPRTDVLTIQMRVHHFPELRTAIPNRSAQPALNLILCHGFEESVKEKAIVAVGA